MQTSAPAGAALGQPLTQPIQLPAAWHGTHRVTGTLTEDARLDPTTGRPPHLLLRLHLQPAHGLPYLATVDLGDDMADHMAAEALEPHLRVGAVLSVGCEGLELRTDHGHAALRLVQPHSVVILQPPPREGARRDAVPQHEA